MSTKLKDILAQYVTQSQACEITGLERHTFLRWIQGGKLDAERVGREVLIKKADLERMIAERSRGG